jgi:hypothetical protein
MTDIAERLRAQSRLIVKWEWWELGKGPAPAAYDFAVQAEVDREAADEIERLRAALAAVSPAGQSVPGYTLDKATMTYWKEGGE